MLCGISIVPLADHLWLWLSLVHFSLKLTQIITINPGTVVRPAVRNCWFIMHNSRNMVLLLTFKMKRQTFYWRPLTWPPAGIHIMFMQLMGNITTKISCISLLSRIHKPKTELYSMSPTYCKTAHNNGTWSFNLSGECSCRFFYQRPCQVSCSHLCPRVLVLKCKVWLVHC